MYWKIEPYHTNEADFCVLPAEDDLDHQIALDYAKERLEEVWDQLGPGEKATVNIELCEGDMPEVD